MDISGERTIALRRPGIRAGFLSTSAAFYLLVAGYFALQIILRVAVSPAVELDEAEQLLLTQQLSWGYGNQGPLFTWLQLLFFQIFGTSVLAIALLKNILLAAIYLVVYACAKLVTGRHGLAVAAAVCVFLSPAFFWEAQRDLTHTVLATALAAATLLVMLQLCTRPMFHLYPALGVCAGLGLLAKGNYLLFLGTLLAAGLSLPKLRSHLLQRRGLLSLTTFILVVFPYGLWTIQHPDLAWPSPDMFIHGSENHWLLSRLRGLGGVVLGMLALFIVPTLLLIALCFTTRLSWPALRVTEPIKLIWRQALLVFVTLVGMVLIFGLSSFKIRWFQPVLIGVPVLLVALWQERLTAPRLRAFVIIGGIVAMAVLVLMPGHLWLSGLRGRPFRLNAPFPELVTQMNSVTPAAELIIAENRWLGGNLRVISPRTTVVVPELPAPSRKEGIKSCVLVWDATKREQPPARLLEFADTLQRIQWSLNGPRFVEAPYRYCTGQQMKLGFIVGEIRGRNPSRLPR